MEMECGVRFSCAADIHNMSLIELRGIKCGWCDKVTSLPNVLVVVIPVCSQRSICRPNGGIMNIWNSLISVHILWLIALERRYFV